MKVVRGLLLCAAVLPRRIYTGTARCPGGVGRENRARLLDTRRGLELIVWKLSTLRTRLNLLILFTAWFLAGCGSTQPTASIGVAGPLKAFDLDGRMVELNSDSPSGPVVLVFVRTDCPISNRYAPEVQRLASRFESKGIRFFLVYCDADETPAMIRKHLHDYHYSIAALRDPALVLARRSAARVTPEAAVFSAAGQLVYHGRIDNRYVDFGRDRPEATEHDLENVLQSVSEGKTTGFVSKPAVGCYITSH